MILCNYISGAVLNGFSVIFPSLLCLESLLSFFRRQACAFALSHNPNCGFPFRVIKELEQSRLAPPTFFLAPLGFQWNCPAGNLLQSSLLIAPSLPHPPFAPIFPQYFTLSPFWDSPPSPSSVCLRPHFFPERGVPPDFFFDR